MVSALEFLRHILPAKGLKCATVLSQTKRFNTHFTSFEDLAAFIATQDALGNTVYHACSSFKTNSRKQDNVVAVRSFWIDCDTQQSHAEAKYADPQAACEAISSFSRRLGLPAPTYVASGYGVHAYWPLVEELDYPTWKKLAQQFKRLCTRNGLDVDQVRTADAASILRTPGTRNRKKGEDKLVQCGALTGPYPLADFLKILQEQNAADLPLLQSKPPGKPSAILPGERRTLFAAAGNIYGDEASDPNTVASACKQIGELRATAGKLAEPIWYAALGVVAACSDGERFAHEWSSGYTGYTPEETSERIRRSQGYGPTTCAHFENINPKGCEGCPYKGKITTPIQLGREASKIRSGLGSGNNEVVRLANGFPSVPANFALDHNGLLFQTENKGAPLTQTISTQPIYLDSIQTGEVTSENFSLCFKLHLPKETVRDISIPTKVFFSASGMSEMAGRGAVIHDGELFRKYTRDAMDVWHKENKLELRYDQFGWKDGENSFLFGANLYTASGVQPVAGSDEIKLRSQYLGPNRTGSLARWSTAANALFAQGCEPQSLALLAAFAAPLMRFHTTGEGGAIISLVSDESAGGKTTALNAVASAWGRLKGTQLTDDDTRVAKGLTLGVLGNIPCVFDELQNRDPEEVRKFVVAFTNGRDKMRGTVDGQLRHSKQDWQTILVLASNSSIVDILESINPLDAQAFRVMEFITSFPPSLVKRGDDLKRELDNNSGFAADAYLKLLLQPETLAYVKQALPTWTDSIWKRTGFADKHRFWVRTLASIVAAGVIVRHTGILDFSVQRILDWAIGELAGRIEDSSVNSGRRPTDVLSEFIHANQTSMLVMPTAWRPHTTIAPKLMPRQGLLMRYELDSKKLWVLESELRKYLVKRGVNRTGFLKELKDKKIITNPHRRMTLGAGTDLASGQVSTLEINMGHPAIFGVVASVDSLIPKAPDGPSSTRAQRIESYEHPGSVVNLRNSRVEPSPTDD